MRGEFKIKEYEKDPKFRVVDQFGINHVYTYTKEDAEAYIKERDNCQHESGNITIGFHPAINEVQLACDFCGAESSFTLPDGLEWG